MEEIFESDNYRISYEKEVNSTFLQWIKYEKRDEFRTPLMHASDMIRKHGCESFIVDRSEDPSPDISESDLRWIGKVFIPSLEKNGLKKIILIGPENVHYPENITSRKISVMRADSYEDAIRSLRPADFVPGDIKSLSREEAVLKMGLAVDANDFAIDERFWQLSKRYRNDHDMPESEKEQKLAEISALYDIATGKRDERRQKEQQRESEKKFLGKTGAEWGNHFHYSWYKYLIAIVLLFVASSLIYNIFIKPKTDCSIISLGHFKYDSTPVMTLLEDDLGFKNPYINNIDVVAPNEEGHRENIYSEQSAATAFYSEPNVLITDMQSLPFYYSELTDMELYYKELETILPPGLYSKIEPVYMSEREAYNVALEYEKQQHMDSIITDESGEKSIEKVLVGLAVYDREYMEKIGYISLWEKSEPAIVFTIPSSTMNRDDSKKIITELLEQMRKSESD